MQSDKNVEPQRLHQAATQETQTSSGASIHFEKQAGMILENIADAIIAFDQAWNFIYVNQRAEHLLQKTQQEIVGKNLWDTFPAYQNTVYESKLRESVEKQQPLVFDISFGVPQQWLQVQTYPAPHGLTVYLTDVSERKRLEDENAAILQAAGRHATLISAMSATLSASKNQKQLFELCVQAFVEQLGVVAAYIWTLDKAREALELQAHAGQELNEPGKSQCILVEASGIGSIVVTQEPYIDNDILHNAFFQDKAWLEREGIIAFAGYPLLLERQVAGVFAIYSRKPLAKTTPRALEAVADLIAQGMAHKRVEEERDSLLTRERETNEIIRGHQERMAIAQQAGRIGAFEWDLSRNEIYWSPEMEALYGLSPNNFEGRYEDWARRIHSEDLPGVQENIQAAIEKRAPYNIEFRIVLSDKTIRWLQGKGEVSFDVTGQASHMIGANIDITERKEAEQGLSQLVQQLQFLSEAGKLLASAEHYGTVVLNIAQYAVPAVADWCRIELWNDDGSIEPLTVIAPGSEQQRQTVSNETALVLPHAAPPVHPPHKVRLYPSITEAVLRNIIPNIQEWESVPAIGNGSAIVVPLKMQEEIVGTITLVISETRYHYTGSDLSIVEELASRMVLAIERARNHQSLQDLNNNLEHLVEQRTAELRKTTETLRMLNTELQRSNQELQDFAYVASHDLQEPLRKIQAFGNLLEEEHGEALGEGEVYLDRMRNAASRMRHLITDLLTFSRVTTKAQPFTPVDLNSIVREVLEDLEPRLQASQGSIEVQDLPTVEADNQQMYQMLQNLLSNALKFHRPDVAPVIKVSARIQERDPQHEYAPYSAHCQLLIEDNGIGFNEKYLDRIFTVFQRLHGKGEYEGTGIGLAVVRKIVERHNGTVTAQSAEGQGATFIINLPVTHNRAEEGDR